MSDMDTEGFQRYGGKCICGPVYTYMGIPEPGHFAPDCPVHGTVDLNGPAWAIAWWVIWR